MNTNDETRSLDELVHAGEVVSLTTVAPDGGLTSRPLTVAEAHGGSVSARSTPGSTTFRVVLPVG